MTHRTDGEDYIIFDFNTKISVLKHAARKNLKQNNRALYAGIRFGIWEQDIQYMENNGCKENEWNEIPIDPRITQNSI